jgi:hypothetical protein
LDTTQEKTFPLPQFESRLWDELEQLHDASNPRRDDDELHPRRRYLVAVAALSAAACLSAVAALVTTGDRDPSGGDVANTLDVEPVRAPDAIVVEVAPSSDGGRTTTWTDEATGNTRTLQEDAAGTPVHETAGRNLRFVWDDAKNDPLVAGSSHLDISHEVHEYAQRAPFEPQAGVLPPGTPPREDDVFQDGVESGQWTPDGTEVVDGIELLRYRSDLSDKGDQVTWVDPTSLRPVKVLLGDETTTFAYLPRTAENIALLDVAVPEGYGKVDDVRVPWALELCLQDADETVEADACEAAYSGSGA